MPVLLRQRALYGAAGPLMQPPAIERVEVDWGHQLANGLIGCYIPTMAGQGSGGVGAGYPPPLRNLSGVGNDLGSQGPGTLSYGPYGLQANADVAGVSANGYQAQATSTQRPASTVSLFTRVYVNGTGSTAAFPMIIGCQINTSNTAPFDCWDFSRLPTAANAQFAWNVGGTASSVTLSGIFSTGAVLNMGATLNTNGVAGNVIAYVNGTVNTTGTASSGTISYQATSTICCNGKVGTNSGLTGLGTLCGYIWNRVLSAAEMAWLNAEPYAFLRPQRRRRWFPATSTPPPPGGSSAGFFFAA